MNNWKLLIKLLMSSTLLVVIGACGTQPTLDSIGTRIPRSEYVSLSNKYDNEAKNRSNEIELFLESEKASYVSTERIKFALSFINKTNKDIVIRKPEAKSSRVGGYYIENYNCCNEEVVFAVTPSDQISLPEFSGPLSISSGALGIPPDDFALVRAHQKYTALMLLPQPIQPLPRGRYSVFVQYRNLHMFGSFVVDEKEESYFIDYHAWMGTLKSNSADFEILP